MSLRVENAAEPLLELRELSILHAAYELAGEADALMGEGRHDEAAERYRSASALAPQNHELLFWAGLGAAHAGDVDAGVADVRAAIAMHRGWRELLPRLPAAVAPAAPLVLDRLARQL